MCDTLGVVSLLVVSGPPGAGKSTVARILADRHSPSALVEGDEFFRFLRAGRIDPWRVEARDQNAVITDIQATVAGRYCSAGYRAIYDGVLGSWFLERFVVAAGVPVDFAVMLPTIETCLHRIRTRVGHDFHNEDAARALHRQFSVESPDARHVVDSSQSSAAETAAEIESRRAAGSLRVG
ncbi:MAG: AAA family ATPase [Ilumatobacteraceae bacterium]